MVGREVVRRGTSGGRVADCQSPCRWASDVHPPAESARRRTARCTASSSSVLPHQHQHHHHHHHHHKHAVRNKVPRITAAGGLKSISNHMTYMLSGVWDVKSWHSSRHNDEFWTRLPTVIWEQAASPRVVHGRPTHGRRPQSSGRIFAIIYCHILSYKTVADNKITEKRMCSKYMHHKTHS